jgi:hypothetical protein
MHNASGKVYILPASAAISEEESPAQQLNATMRVTGLGSVAAIWSISSRVGAISRTIPRITSPAPALFIYKATTVWFIPKMKGKQGKRSTDVAVLPDEFYDINTWDTEARPDSTRGRWRLGIHKCLAAMEEAAVVHVTEILDREQLLDEAY